MMRALLLFHLQDTQFYSFLVGEENYSTGAHMLKNELPEGEDEVNCISVEEIAIGDKRSSHALKSVIKEMLPMSVIQHQH